MLCEDKRAKKKPQKKYLKIEFREDKDRLSVIENSFH